MIDFNNTEIAFRSKSDVYLRKSKMLFGIMKHGGIVKIGKNLYFFAKKIHFPTDWIIRSTVYEHFAVGATLEACKETVKDLKNYKVTSILDFSAEGGQGDKSIQIAFDKTINSID